MPLDTYVHDGNLLLAWGAKILEHVLDEDSALGDLLVDDELLIVGRDEKYHGCEWKTERSGG